MRLPKVSVIIPVYNAAKNIDKLLSMVFDQPYKNIEVIAVDDGSSDESLKLLKKLASENEKLTVVHQKNKGPAAARNVGIDRASGKYVMFFDADDEIHKNMIEIMACEAEKTGVDMVVCGMLEITEKRTNEMKFAPNMIGKNLRKSVLVSLARENCFYSLCNKLFLRERIGELRQREDLKFGEDLTFVLEYLKKCKKVSVLEKILYCYWPSREGVFTQSAAEYVFREKNKDELEKFAKSEVEKDWVGWIQTKWTMQYLRASARVKKPAGRRAVRLLGKKPGRKVVGTKIFLVDRSFRALVKMPLGVRLTTSVLRVKYAKLRRGL